MSRDRGVWAANSWGRLNLSERVSRVLQYNGTGRYHRAKEFETLRSGGVVLAVADGTRVSR